MHRKHALMLSATALLVLAYALLSIFRTADSPENAYHRDAEISSTSEPYVSLETNRYDQTNDNQPDRSKTSEAKRNALTTKNDLALPLALKLIGTDGDTQALIESAGVAQQYQLQERVFGREIVLIDVNQDNVVVEYQSTPFMLNLIGPNLLANKANDAAPYVDVLSAEEIGNRPKRLEHIVALSTPNTRADGMIAMPGVSPKLFTQAGLKEGDIINSINGLNPNNPQQLEQLQRMIPNADTLIFQVNRDGRLITVFLDIPSPALHIQ
ncbi:hypothetical protein KJ365_12230 [Glaciecola sp. XM2]|jgi:type II secretion system protein C|uniref:hypothetical protein n=1 Tax=Glaciecola sp. XM2 TaxID=1914931 RepID=UPI001BDE394C|nr:hypothetical protein [Glaciecola sp. XM2]MBT1451650.1 hypothetical protein [Glaciecola sp. XM2]